MYVLRFVFRSTTALGFSLLSYGGNLHLSLMADRSIVKDERLFMEFLENTVHEIDAAYNIILMRFSKSSDLPIETPMKKGMQIEFLIILTFYLYSHY